MTTSMGSAPVDFLIIGSGIAGLFTALVAQEFGSVTVVTKAALGESNTRYAQGGIAAATAREDSPWLHHDDTIVAGAGLCDDPAVRVLTEEAPARIYDLIRFGVEFDRENGDLARCLEGAHSMARVLHAGGDATGARIATTLAARARESSIAVHEHTFVTRLELAAGRCSGAWILADGGQHFIPARKVVIAAGGAGRLFQFTTNPEGATADGIATAYRAGAALADLEFFQFHPTALHLPGAPTFLISEAVRGEGGILRNAQGERFMPRYDERAELASRDVVSRAMLAEMRRSSTRDHAWLDVTHLPAERIRSRFPSIVATCLAHGIDPSRHWIPVRPAAHYMMGGIRTNTWGETTVPALFACGEAACTGVHGANRLASNSLLEGIVFGHRVVRAAVGDADGMPWEPVLDAEDLVESIPLPNPPRVLPGRGEGERLPLPLGEGRGEGPEVPACLAGGGAEGSDQLSRTALQQLMWDFVGIERTAETLEHAVRVLSTWQAELPEPETAEDYELGNLVLTGRLMAIAALDRTESRGGHFRADYPARDPAWRRRIVFQASAPSAAGEAEREVAKV